MDFLLQKYSIVSAPQTKLKKCLVASKTKMLESIARDNDVYLQHGLTKARIADAIMPVILNKFKRDMEYITISELKFLHKMNSENQFKVDDLIYNEYAIFVNYGYVYIYNYEKHLYPVLPDEIKEMLPSVLTDKFKQIILFNQKLFTYIRALLNLYGVFDIQQLMEVWNLYSNEKISNKNIERFFKNIKYYQKYDFTFYKGVLISTYFNDENEEEFEALFDAVFQRPYYIPTIEDIEYFSKNEFDQRTIHFKKIQDFIGKKIAKSDNIYEDVVLEIINASVMDQEPNEIFEIMDSYGINLNVKEIQEFLPILIDLSNNTRKWILRGYTPEELSEKYDRPNLKPLPDKPFTVIKGKIGRNDPCPCGSGRKYKQCCGG